MNTDQHEQSLDRLPEVALLEVLKLLRIEDLLTCRLVCKRLGELAMHPTVWRERRLGRGENDEKLACPVLRLTPCLGWMLVRHLQPSDSPSNCCDHLYTTDCALGSMDVHCWSDTSLAAQVALLIQRQAFLGRLRRLQVKLITRGVAGDGQSILFRTLALTPGLESLAISTDGMDTGVLRFRKCALSVHVSSSIKSVSFRFPGRESFVNFVLSKHAASLETALFSRSASAPTLQLLAGLPRLRELTCRIQPGLQVLVASETLQALTILVAAEQNLEVAADPADAVELVRRAPRQLRELSLSWRFVSIPTHDHSADVAVELLRAAASGAARSRIERLSVELERCRCRSGDELVEQEQREVFDAVLAALPELPALRELRVRAKSYDGLLLGLVAAPAPALWCLSVTACAHALLHDSAALVALLTARPSLHVRVSYNILGFEDQLPWCAACGHCPECKLDCHPELRGASSEATSACLYREGHRPAQTYGPDCIMVSV